MAVVGQPASIEQHLQIGSGRITRPEHQEMRVFKCSGKSGAQGRLASFGDAVDQADLVLDREWPRRKGAIWTRGLSAFDFRLERLDKRWPVNGLREPGQIEVGHLGLAMHAGDERRGRMALRGAEGFEIGRFKQSEIAFLGVLARLRAPLANGIEA